MPSGDMEKKKGEKEKKRINKLKKDTLKKFYLYLNLYLLIII